MTKHAQAVYHTRAKPSAANKRGKGDTYLMCHVNHLCVQQEGFSPLCEQGGERSQTQK